MKKYAEKIKFLLTMIPMSKSDFKNLVQDNYEDAMNLLKRNPSLHVTSTEVEIFLNDLCNCFKLKHKYMHMDFIDKKVFELIEVEERFKYPIKNTDRVEVEEDQFFYTNDRFNRSKELLADRYWHIYYINMAIQSDIKREKLKVDRKILLRSAEDIDGAIDNLKRNYFNNAREGRKSLQIDQIVKNLNMYVKYYSFSGISVSSPIKKRYGTCCKYKYKYKNENEIFAQIIVNDDKNTAKVKSTLLHEALHFILGVDTSYLDLETTITEISSKILIDIREIEWINNTHYYGNEFFHKIQKLIAEYKVTEENINFQITKNMQEERKKEYYKRYNHFKSIYNKSVFWKERASSLLNTFSIEYRLMLDEDITIKTTNGIVLTLRYHEVLINKNRSLSKCLEIVNFELPVGLRGLKNAKKVLDDLNKFITINKIKNLYISTSQSDGLVYFWIKNNFKFLFDEDETRYMMGVTETLRQSPTCNAFVPVSHKISLKGFVGLLDKTLKPCIKNRCTCIYNPEGLNKIALRTTLKQLENYPLYKAS